MLVGTQSGKLYAVVVRTGVFAGSVTVALGLLGSSALAQSCGDLKVNVPFSFPFPPTVSFNLTQPVATGLSGGLAVSAAVSAANTAFLTQSTAFVSAPANPKPDSEGSGIWIRGVGGELTLNSNTQVNLNLTVPPGGFAAPNTYSANTTCSAQFHQSFGGFQLGQDIAKLNVAGWNLTLGTTAGFLETNGSITGGNVSGGAFNSTTQAPFVGTYGVATYGNFFIDGLFRLDYFQTDLNSPSANLFGQKLDAHGFTAAASAGYNWKIPNSNWFIEPSAGVVWSRETVDPFNAANPVANDANIQTASFSGTTQVNTIESIIGRIGVRVGTTVESKDVVYQPFAAVSVWHDFAGNITANYSSCPHCVFVGGEASTLAASTSTNNIGTFGQYSVGLSAAVKNTGWLGFGRVDYREGPEMHGLSATGGIRYQFTPTEVASAMPVKAKAPVLVDHPVNWTGWYAGLVGGATEYGRGLLEFPGVSTAETRPAGWLGGGTLGYNYQAGKWVFGLEGDIVGTNANGSSQCAPLNAGQTGIAGPLFQTTCHDELNWLATATARLGYAWTPRSLLYVKAGGAFTDEKASVTCNLGPLNGSNPGQNCTDSAGNFFAANTASISNFRAGWTVGIGTEFALTDRWSIKGEFDWLDFGTKSLTLSDGTAINSSLHIAEGKIGLNYKFWP